MTQAERWTALLRAKIAEAPDLQGLWVYAPELREKTGAMLPLYDDDQVLATIAAFRDDPTFEVYTHTTNRYADEKPEDRYFVIRRRQLAPGIAWS